MITADIEIIIESFEAAQQQFGTPQIEAYVGEFKGDLRCEAVVELVRSDIEYRWRNELELVDLETYRSRFPDVLDDPKHLSQIAFEEFRQKRSRGLTCSACDYRDRLQIDISTWQTATVPPATSESPQTRATTLLPRPEYLAAIKRHFNDFRPVMELGCGAAGRVFLATQGELAKRLVVIKVTNELTVEPQQLAQLQHTNIVPIYSLHRWENWQVVCMPFLGHVTLADVIRFNQNEARSMPSDARALMSTIATKAEESIRHNQQHDSTSDLSTPPAEVHWTPAQFHFLPDLDYVNTCAWFAARIAQGLAHAHRRGIVHSDLKPSNILIGNDGEPMLLDFHLAHQSLSADPSWVGGTLAYMSAEHMRKLRMGRTADATCDLFALGAIFYQLLTGRLPQEPRPAPDINFDQWESARQAPVVPPSKYNPLISRDLESVVLKCLAIAPADRYAHAEELQTDLDRHLQDLPPRFARSHAPLEHAHKWLRRHPAVRSASFVSIAACIVVAVVASWYAWHNRQLAADNALGQFTAFEHQFHEAETVLASAGFGGLNPRAQVDEITRQLSEWGALDAEIPPWTKRLPADLQAQFQLKVSELNQMLARIYLELHRQTFLANDESTHLQASRNHHARAVRFRHPHPLTPALRWQAWQLEQTSEENWVLDEPQLFQQWWTNQNVVSSDLGWQEQRYLAFAAFLAGDTDRAIDLLERGLPYHSQDLAGWTLLGHAYAKQRQFDKAASCYFVSHTIRPNIALPLFYIGLVRQDAGSPSEALVEFNRSIELDPNQPVYFANRALANFSLGHLPEALADCNRAFDLGIDQTRLYFVRSRIRRAMGDEKGASDDYQQGLQAKPTDELSWIARGFAKASTDPENAIEDFAQAIQLNPRSASALESSAALYCDRLNDSARAIDFMSRLVDAEPRVARHVANRGVLYARIGNSELALADASHALQLSQNADTYYRIAGLFAQLSVHDTNHASTAINLLQAAAAADPNLVAKYLQADDPDLRPLNSLENFINLRNAVDVVVGGFDTPAEKPGPNLP